jgi:hypothetical protein
VNRYEGLNLPQLVELLHGPEMPEPVSWMPQTPGWWVLLGWLIAVSALGFIALVRHRRRNRYRREAEAVLGDIRSSADEDGQAAAAEIASLLKRTALVAYPRSRVASLYGRDWAQFLVESTDGDALVTAAAEGLARAAYGADADCRELIPAAQRWIRTHRA